MPNYKIYVAEGDDLIYQGEVETDLNTEALGEFLDAAEEQGVDVDTDEGFEVIEEGVNHIDVEQRERVFSVGGEALAPKRSGTGKRRGRPPKSESAAEAPKRRGRPPGSGKKKPGRPKGSTNKTTTTKPAAAPKKRGRPKGSKNRKSPFKGGGGSDDE